MCFIPSYAEPALSSALLMTMCRSCHSFFYRLAPSLAVPSPHAAGDVLRVGVIREPPASLNFQCGFGHGLYILCFAASRSLVRFVFHVLRPVCSSSLNRLRHSVDAIPLRCLYRSRCWDVARSIVAMMGMARNLADEGTNWFFLAMGEIFEYGSGGFSDGGCSETAPVVIIVHLHSFTASQCKATCVYDIWTNT
jgi:hypothetical protein